MKVTEKEFENWYRNSVTVAGPDDPIYSSGLTRSFVRLPANPPIAGSKAQDKPLPDLLSKGAESPPKPI